MDSSFLQNLSNKIASEYPLLMPITEARFDGSVNRYDSTKQGDKAIWACIHEWEYKGNFYKKAFYGSWRAGVQHSFSSYEDDKRIETNKEFKQFEKEHIKNMQDELDRKKQELRRGCRERWAPIYFSLPADSPTHSYLKSKKINSNFHARVNEKDVLLVPAWNSKGEFVGGQRIYLDPVTDKYEKRFTYGIDKKGSFCPFGDIRNAEFIYVAEGFATAASIYMAFKSNPNIAVVCVWDTSNLLEGAQAVRQVNHSCYLIFAADRDINAKPELHNIGEKKAKFASFKLSNSIVKTVKFEAGNDKWSDYNDLHAFEGLEHVARQLQVDQTDFIDIIPLGFNESKAYFFSTARKQIIEFSKSDFNPTNFMIQAPPKFWGDRYGYLVNKDGEKTQNPDWKKVISKIGLELSKKGFFNHSKVRGVGAWEQNNEMIVNTGDKLYYKNEFFPLFNNGIKSDYFYQSSETIDLNFNRPLGNTDAIKIVEAFKLLKFKNPSDYIIVLGWIFSAQIFASLPWRPHIWLTGSKGSGKSTILNYISDMIDFSLIVQDSTASGIRQRLLNNAMAIIYDESEPNTEKDRERMSEILAMARQSSTRSKYEILRGTASGKSISYNTNTCFCMGSIQLSDMSGADTSRFFIIEMENIKGQSHEDFVRLENAMAEARDFSTGLFIRAVNMYDNHIKNIEKAKSIIKEQKIESRQADQLAPIIAGYYAFFDTGEISESFVHETIALMNFKTSNYAEQNEEDESDKCLEDILDIQIPGKSIKVAQIIEKYQYEMNQALKDEYDQMLGLIGMRYMEAERRLFIEGTSSLVRRELKKFSRFTDYKNVLARHESFVEYDRIRVAGKPRRGFTVSVD